MPDELDDDLERYLDPLPRTPSLGPYDEIINRHAQRTGLNPALIGAVAYQESTNNPRATSPKNARGVMQLMGPTAKRFGVTDPYDPEQSIRGGSDYLKFLSDRYNGDIDRTLAGYNAGEGAVDRYHGVPPYAETQNYVRKIKQRLGNSAFTRTPPAPRPTATPQALDDDLENYLDPPANLTTLADQTDQDLGNYLDTEEPPPPRSEMEKSLSKVGPPPPTEKEAAALQAARAATTGGLGGEPGFSQLQHGVEEQDNQQFAQGMQAVTTEAPGWSVETEPGTLGAQPKAGTPMTTEGVTAFTPEQKTGDLRSQIRQQVLARRGAPWYSLGSYRNPGTWLAEQLGEKDMLGAARRIFWPTEEENKLTTANYGLPVPVHPITQQESVENEVQSRLEQIQETTTRDLKLYQDSSPAQRDFLESSRQALLDYVASHSSDWWKTADAAMFDSVAKIFEGASGAAHMIDTYISPAGVANEVLGPAAQALGLDPSIVGGPTFLERFSLDARRAYLTMADVVREIDDRKNPDHVRANLASQVSQFLLRNTLPTLTEMVPAALMMEAGIPASVAFGTHAMVTSAGRGEPFAEQLKHGATGYVEGYGMQLAPFARNPVKLPEGTSVGRQAFRGLENLGREAAVVAGSTAGAETLSGATPEQALTATASNVIFHTGSHVVRIPSELREAREWSQLTPPAPISPEVRAQAAADMRAKLAEAEAASDTHGLRTVPDVDLARQFNALPVEVRRAALAGKPDADPLHVAMGEELNRRGYFVADFFGEGSVMAEPPSGYGRVVNTPRPEGDPHGIYELGDKELAKEYNQAPWRVRRALMQGKPEVQQANPRLQAIADELDRRNYRPDMMTGKMFRRPNVPKPVAAPTPVTPAAEVAQPAETVTPAADTTATTATTVQSSGRTRAQLQSAITRAQTMLENSAVKESPAMTRAFSDELKQAQAELDALGGTGTPATATTTTTETTAGPTEWTVKQESARRWVATRTNSTGQPETIVRRSERVLRADLGVIQEREAAARAAAPRPRFEDWAEGQANAPFNRIGEQQIALLAQQYRRLYPSPAPVAAARPNLQVGQRVSLGNRQGVVTKLAGTTAHVRFDDGADRTDLWSQFTPVVTPTNVRRMSVNGQERTVELTPENAAKWDELDQQLQNATPAQRNKGLAMRIAAAKRQLHPDLLTDKERSARAAREATNYQGKQVVVEGRPAEVVRTSFGKVQVKYADGTVENVAPERIGTPAPVAPVEIATPAPTGEGWVQIPEGRALPGGYDIRMDMAPQGGGQWVRRQADYEPLSNDTRHTHKELRELGYTPADYNKMNWGEKRDLVDNNVRKPPPPPAAEGVLQTIRNLTGAEQHPLARGILAHPEWKAEVLRAIGEGATALPYRGADVLDFRTANGEIVTIENAYANKKAPTIGTKLSGLVIERAPAPSATKIEVGPRQNPDTKKWEVVLPTKGGGTRVHPADSAEAAANYWDINKPKPNSPWWQKIVEFGKNPAGYLDLGEIQRAIDDFRERHPGLSEEEARKRLEELRPYLFLPNVSKQREDQLMEADRLAEEGRVPLTPEARYQQLREQVQQQNPFWNESQVSQWLLTNHPDLVSAAAGEMPVQDLGDVEAPRSEPSAADEFARRRTTTTEDLLNEAFGINPDIHNTPLRETVQALRSVESGITQAEMLEWLKRNKPALIRGMTPTEVQAEMTAAGLVDPVDNSPAGRLQRQVEEAWNTGRYRDPDVLRAELLQAGHTEAQADRAIEQGLGIPGPLSKFNAKVQRARIERLNPGADRAEIDDELRLARHEHFNYLADRKAAIEQARRAATKIPEEVRAQTLQAVNTRQVRRTETLDRAGYRLAWSERGGWGVVPGKLVAGKEVNLGPTDITVQGVTKAQAEALTLRLPAPRSVRGPEVLETQQPTTIDLTGQAVDTTVEETADERYQRRFQAALDKLKTYELPPELEARREAALRELFKQPATDRAGRQVATLADIRDLIANSEPEEIARHPAFQMTYDQVEQDHPEFSINETYAETVRRVQEMPPADEVAMVQATIAKQDAAQDDSRERARQEIADAYLVKPGTAGGKLISPDEAERLAGPAGDRAFAAAQDTDTHPLQARMDAEAEIGAQVDPLALKADIDEAMSSGKVRGRTARFSVFKEDGTFAYTADSREEAERTLGDSDGWYQPSVASAGFVDTVEGMTERVGAKELKSLKLTEDTVNDRYRRDIADQLDDDALKAKYIKLVGELKAAKTLGMRQQLLKEIDSLKPQMEARGFLDRTERGKAAQFQEYRDQPSPRDQPLTTIPTNAEYRVVKEKDGTYTAQWHHPDKPVYGEASGLTRAEAKAQVKQWKGEARGSKLLRRLKAFGTDETGGLDLGRVKGLVERFTARLQERPGDRDKEGSYSEQFMDRREHATAEYLGQVLRMLDQPVAQLQELAKQPDSAAKVQQQKVLLDSIDRFVTGLDTRDQKGPWSYHIKSQFERQALLDYRLVREGEPNAELAHWIDHYSQRDYLPRALENIRKDALKQAGNMMGRDHPDLEQIRALLAPAGETGVVGPHNDREIELLQAGTKPLAMFHANAPQVREAEAAGLATAPFTIKGSTGEPAYAMTAIARTKAEALAGAAKLEAAHRGVGPTQWDNAAIGKLLGYSAADIEAYHKNLQRLQDEGLESGEPTSRDLRYGRKEVLANAQLGDYPVLNRYHSPNTGRQLGRDELPHESESRHAGFDMLHPKYAYSRYDRRSGIIYVNEQLARLLSHRATVNGWASLVTPELRQGVVEPRADLYRQMLNEQLPAIMSRAELQLEDIMARGKVKLVKHDRLYQGLQDYAANFRQAADDFYRNVDVPGMGVRHSVITPFTRAIDLAHTNTHEAVHAVDPMDVQNVTRPEDIGAGFAAWYRTVMKLGLSQLSGTRGRSDAATVAAETLAYALGGDIRPEHRAEAFAAVADIIARMEEIHGDRPVKELANRVSTYGEQVLREIADGAADRRAQAGAGDSGVPAGRTAGAAEGVSQPTYQIIRQPANGEIQVVETRADGTKRVQRFDSYDDARQFVYGKTSFSALSEEPTASEQDGSESELRRFLTDETGAWKIGGIRDALRARKLKLDEAVDEARKELPDWVSPLHVQTVLQRDVNQDPLIGITNADETRAAADPFRRFTHRLTFPNASDTMGHDVGRWRYEPQNQTVYWEDKPTAEESAQLRNYLGKQGLEVKTDAGLAEHNPSRLWATELDSQRRASLAPRQRPPVAAPTPLSEPAQAAQDMQRTAAQIEENYQALMDHQARRLGLREARPSTVKGYFNGLRNFIKLAKDPAADFTFLKQAESAYDRRDYGAATQLTERVLAGSKDYLQRLREGVQAAGLEAQGQQAPEWRGIQGEMARKVAASLRTFWDDPTGSVPDLSKAPRDNKPHRLLGPIVEPAIKRLWEDTERRILKGELKVPDVQEYVRNQFNEMLNTHFSEWSEINKKGAIAKAMEVMEERGYRMAPLNKLIAEQIAEKELHRLKEASRPLVPEPKDRYGKTITAREDDLKAKLDALGELQAASPRTLGMRAKKRFPKEYAADPVAATDLLYKALLGDQPGERAMYVQSWQAEVGRRLNRRATMLAKVRADWEAEMPAHQAPRAPEVENQWLTAVNQLDAQKFPDKEYKKLFGETSQPRLKKNETWRSRALEMAENEARVHAAQAAEPQIVELPKGLKPRALYKHLEDTGRLPGGHPSYTPERLADWKVTAEALIKDHGADWAQEFYDNAKPSGVRTSVGLALGDHYLTEGIRTNDPALIEKAVKLSDERVLGATSLGQAVVAFRGYSRETLSGALDEAGKLYRKVKGVEPDAPLPAKLAVQVAERVQRLKTAQDGVIKVMEKVAEEAQAAVAAAPERAVKVVKQSARSPKSQWRKKVEALDQQRSTVDTDYRRLLSNENKGPLARGETWRKRVLSLADLEDAQTAAQAAVAAAPPQSRYRAMVAELDALQKPDEAYRSLLSTGTKARLKKGETWRGRVLKYAELEEQSLAKQAAEEEPGLAERFLPSEEGSAPSIEVAAFRARKQAAKQALKAVERLSQANRAAFDDAHNKLRDASFELNQLMDALKREASPYYIRGNNLVRSEMVSAFSTHVRNAETQGVRVTVERLTDAFELGMRRMLGLDTDLTVGGIVRGITRVGQISADPKYGFSAVRKTAEQIVAEHPDELARLFTTYSGDKPVKGLADALSDRSTYRQVMSKLLGGAEKVAFLTNYFNRVQEFHLRSAEFVSDLDNTIRRTHNMTLEQFLQHPDYGAAKLDPKLIRRSIDKALEVTFAAGAPSDTFTGRQINNIIQVGNLFPPTLTPVAFPRFMYNNLKFMYQYSPLGVIDVARPGYRATRGESALRPVARSMIGLGMLGAAYATRVNYGGEKWYEVRVPGTSDRYVDARPFGPFSVYLFFAEAGRRLVKGQSMSLREWSEALGSTSSVTGLSQAAIERAWGYWDRGNTDQAQKQIFTAMKQEGGEVGRAVLTPVRQLKDVIAQFSKEEAKARDTNESPFLGPMRESIPFASRGLPEAHLATTATPIHQDQPALKAILGPRIETKKTYLQHELDRLRFQPADIRSYTGVAPLDRQVTRHLGEILDVQSEKLRTDPRYQAANDDTKQLLLHHVLEGARARATAMAKKELPAAAKENKQNRVDRWTLLQRKVVRERREAAGLPVPPLP